MNEASSKDEAIKQMEKQAADLRGQIKQFASNRSQVGWLKIQLAHKQEQLDSLKGARH